MTTTGQRERERHPATHPNHNTQAIECLLMDKCTFCRSIPHATPVASKCVDRCIDVRHGWTDILITCSLHFLWLSCAPGDGSATAPACRWWKSGLEQKKKERKEKSAKGQSKTHPLESNTPILLISRQT